MAKSRKNGLHMILANQVLGQKMNEEMKDLILGNTTIKIAGKNEKKSIDGIGEEMGGLERSNFDRLPKYNFYVYDRDNHDAGIDAFHTSSKLVDIKPPIYMNKAELKEFLLWTVHESGFYKETPSGVVTAQGDATSGPFISPQNDSRPYDPQFED